MARLGSPQGGEEYQEAARVKEIRLPFQIQVYQEWRRIG